MTLRISEGVYAAICAHAEKAYPEEAAGFLLGRVDGDSRVVVTALPQDNHFETDQRRRRYLIEAGDMLRAEQYAEEQGFEILGIFHSHPDHPPEPSRFDLEWSLPWFSYLITSVQNGKTAASRCWRLNEDRSQFDEEEIE